MSKDWPYAKMAQDAADAGGPDKWIKVIKEAAYDAGAADMKHKLVLPLLATGIGFGSVCVIGVQKFYKWAAEKKRERLTAAQEAVEAEEYLKEKLTEAADKTETDDGCIAE